MKIKRNLIQNKRGVSTLFIAIYIVLLAVLLISTIFVGLVISKSGITDYLKVEQERMQENIVLFRLTTDENDEYVQTIIVNNTGSITVRIKALYIDQTIICDPSTLNRDSYIAPKESLNITLFPQFPIRIEDTLTVQWAVTTERGTKSSEKGINLWLGNDDGLHSSNKFYFGPLMILFDMFHWRSGMDSWNSGWTIPKGTDEVTWRILLTNVDDQVIKIKDNSCFTLVGNDNIPNSILPWYIDPIQSSSLTFQPGGWYFVYFTWSKPFSEGGASTQSINKFSEEITCKNFLTFAGDMIYLNGTTTPFGQTIPFEAVLITTPGGAIQEATMTADPTSLVAVGDTQTSAISISIKDENGDPLTNTQISFTTTIGTISSSTATTDSKGEATTTLLAGSTPGNAVVTATWEDKSKSILVPLRTPILTVNSNRQTIKVGTTGQSKATITAVLTDPNGNLVVGAPVSFATDLGSISDTIDLTDSQGQAIVTLTAGPNPGIAKITVTCGVATSTTTVTITN